MTENLAIRSLPVPVTPAGEGIFFNVQMADSSINSPWHSDRSVEQSRQPQYMRSQELAYRLCDSRAAMGQFISPALTIAILNALAEFGVNPDELVRADQ